MSDALQLYRQAQSLGLRLEADGDSLLVWPKSKCPVELADQLRQHKAELLDWLNSPPCPSWQAVPPTDMPLDPVLPRPTPEDRERVIGYMVRQTGGRTGSLTAWLARRESAYYEGPGRTWDCALHGYVAARDAACWQLNRSERDVLELLVTFESAARGAE